MAKMSMKEMREKAASKALGEDAEEEAFDAGADAEAAVEDEVAAEDAMGGEIPPQVVEALEGLPLPVLEAILAKIQEIIAGKEGGEAEGADMMGGAPPMPMPVA